MYLSGSSLQCTVSVFLEKKISIILKKKKQSSCIWSLKGEKRITTFKQSQAILNVRQKTTTGKNKKQKRLRGVNTSHRPKWRIQ